MTFKTGKTGVILALVGACQRLSLQQQNCLQVSFSLYIYCMQNEKLRVKMFTVYLTVMMNNRKSADIIVYFY